MRSLADTERSPLGYSPAEVLDFAGSQQLSLQDLGQDRLRLTATLTLQPKPGTARFIQTELVRSVSVPDPCRGRVEQGVELDLDLELASGTVQLHGAGTLRSDSRYRATLRAQLSPADAGLFHDIELQPEDKLDAIELRATLTPAGSAGLVEAQVETLVRVGPQPEPRGDAPRARDYTTERQVVVASWPAASGCGLGELRLPVDRALFEISPADVLSAFAQPRELRWSDGTSTRVKLEARPTADACLADVTPSWHEPYDYPPIAPEEPVLFGLPIDLMVATEDGRFRTQFSAMLQYEPKKPGGLSRAWLVRYATLAPGDAGGWAGDVADISEVRTTVLRILHQPEGTVADEGSILLAGPPSAETCDSTPPCVNAPPRGVTLLRGTLD